MSTVDIEYGAARRSDSINRKFVGVVPPGPYKGFNIAWSGTGLQVKISNLDEPGEENVLLTPQGVRIRESGSWEGLVTGSGAVGSYAVVCRYDHSQVGSEPEYLIVLSAAVVATTDTVLGAFYIGAPAVDYAAIPFVEGTRYRDGGAKIPITAIDGAGKDAVVGEMPLFGVEWATNLPAGAQTLMYFYGLIPRDFDDRHFLAAYVRVFFATDTDGNSGDIKITVAINDEQWPAARGQPPEGGNEFGVFTLPDNGVSDSRWWVDVPFPTSAWNPGRPFRMIIAREGADAEDTFPIALYNIFPVIVYPRAKVGAHIDDLQLVTE